MSVAGQDGTTKGTSVRRRARPSGTTGPVTSPLVRVATVPAQHPYLDSALPPDVQRVDVPGVRDAPWAPSPLLDADVLAARADKFDLLHLHFGFDHLSTDELRRWTGALVALDVPLVLTVHDLRNPHHDSPAQHDEHLRVLLSAAAQVLTLTDGAAREIAARWGRSATVVPHPAVLDRTGTSTHGLVGVHLKSLRRNVIEPDRVVAAVLGGVRFGGGTLRVDVHPDTVDDPALAGTRALAAGGELELREHERFTDDELADYLQSLHASVLAQRFGTHSGWLEACRDVGTAVVAPSCGYYGEQWSQVHVYTHDEQHGLDAGSLTAAVHAALDIPPPPPVDPAFRARQRAEVQRAHTDVYRRALAGRRVLR